MEKETREEEEVSGKSKDLKNNRVPQTGGLEMRMNGNRWWVGVGVRSWGGGASPPYQQHMIQQLQVTIGTLPAIVQGSKPHIRGHFWVESCFLFIRVAG